MTSEIRVSDKPAIELKLMIQPLAEVELVETAMGFLFTTDEHVTMLTVTERATQ